VKKETEKDYKKMLESGNRASRRLAQKQLKKSKQLRG